MSTTTLRDHCARVGRDPGEIETEDFERALASSGGPRDDHENAS